MSNFKLQEGSYGDSLATKMKAKLDRQLDAVKDQLNSNLQGLLLPNVAEATRSNNNIPTA